MNVIDVPIKGARFGQAWGLGGCRSAVQPALADLGRRSMDASKERLL